MQQETEQTLPNLSNYIQFLIIKKSFLKNKSRSDYVLGCCKGVINNTDNYKNKKKEKKQYNNHKVELSLVCKKWYQQIMILNKRFHFELNKKKKIGTNYLSDLANQKLDQNTRSLLLYDKRYIKVLVLHFSTSSKYSKHRDKIGYKNTHCKKITDTDIQWIVTELPMLEIVKIKSEPLYIDEIYRIVKHIEIRNSTAVGGNLIKVQLKLNFQFHSIPSSNPLDYPSDLDEKYSLEQFECIERSQFKLYSYENSHGFSDQFIENCLRYYKVGYTNLEIYHGNQEEEGYFKLNTSEIFKKSSGFSRLLHLDFGRFNSTPIEHLIVGLRENQLKTLRSGISFSRFNKGHSFQEGCNFTNELITDNKHQQWIEFCNTLATVNHSLKRLHLFDFYRSPNDQDDLSCNGDDDLNSASNQQQTIIQQQAYYYDDQDDQDEETTSSGGELFIDTESTQSQTSNDSDDDNELSITTTINPLKTGERTEIKKNKYVEIRMNCFSSIWSINTSITFLNLQDFRHLPASFYLEIANNNKTIKHLLLSNSTMDNINDDNKLVFNAFCEMITKNKTIISLSINSKYIQFTNELIQSFSTNSTIKHLSIEGCSTVNISQFFSSLLQHDILEYISISKNMKKQSLHYFTHSKSLIIKYIENDKNKNYNLDFAINWYRLIKNE